MGRTEGNNLVLGSKVTSCFNCGGMLGSASKGLEFVSEAWHGHTLIFKVVYFFLQLGMLRAALCSRELPLPFLSWGWINDPSRLDASLAHGQEL